MVKLVWRIINLDGCSRRLEKCFLWERKLNV